MAKAHLVLSSPAGIALATAGDTHIACDRHFAISTGKSISIASAANLYASIRQTFRLFVQKAGLKLVAAGGDVDIEALSNNINILAKLEISQQADRITISAQKEIVLNGGGSYAKFAAGKIELGTTGNFVVHAAAHSLIGASSINIANKTLSSADEQEVLEEKGWVEFNLETDDGPLPKEKFILTDSRGNEHRGNTDENGWAKKDGIPCGRCKLEFPDIGYITVNDIA